MSDMPEWPTTTPIADELIRYCAARGLWCSAASFEALPERVGPGPAMDHYMLLVSQMQHNFDLVLALKEIQRIDPTTADEVAAQIWTAADAGDSYGEWLWQWCNEIGMDADAIHAAGRSYERPEPREGT